MLCTWKFELWTCLQMNEPNAYGNTPLHVACYNGQDVVVNELIECGANVNQVNEKGFAPLHFTAASRHGALCLELLVGNGADVNIKVGPLLELCMKQKSPLILIRLIVWLVIHHCFLLVQSKDGKTPLHMTAIHGRFSRSQAIIQNGESSFFSVHYWNLQYLTASCFTYV